ncbi:hypothetical protein L3Y34_003313 [Caenorhabditis briggsae]|uniref:Uncharacterized protein n=1 Tax=Caenorhabditis briggsae TaxID=6238 RepID=A0AAE9A933_CAEBR|nr:hypothetical protein L3Y34_003313 [Caenorhabditis briggsae]
MVRHRLVDSLELYIKYEFLKRNTYEDAHQNLREMIRSNEEFQELRDNEEKLKNQENLQMKNLNLQKLIRMKNRKRRKENWRVLGRNSRKNMTHGLQAQNMLFSTADCLKLLLLRNSSFSYKKDLKYKTFPMKSVIIRRAYGKVKVQMLNPSKPCQNAEYWRCENSGCIVWHGYHARIDKSRRFQRMASAELERVLCSSSLDEIEFKTEDHNSWNPNVDPFFTLVKYMKMNLDEHCICTKKVSMELGWFGDTSKENNTFIKYLLKNMSEETLETIKFRKWNGSR